MTVRTKETSGPYGIGFADGSEGAVLTVVFCTRIKLQGERESGADPETA